MLEPPKCWSHLDLGAIQMLEPHLELGAIQMLEPPRARSHSDVEATKSLEPFKCWSHLELGAIQMLEPPRAWSHSDVGAT